MPVPAGVWVAAAAAAVAVVAVAALGGPADWPPAWVPHAAAPAASETRAIRYGIFTRAWTRRLSGLVPSSEIGERQERLGG
jgi:hypothetical protein